MCGGLSRVPTGDLACSPGMCPDWESNWLYRTLLNPLSYTTQGWILSFLIEAML